MWFLPIRVSLVMFRNMLKMNRNIHQTHLRAGRVGPESTYMMALSRTPQCVPDRRRWKTLVEPKVKRRAGLTGNYSNLCEFIYFTIRKNKERGSSSASKASLETVLPSRKTNPLFLTLDKFWSSRNESRDEKPVQTAFYPQAGEMKNFWNCINLCQIVLQFDENLWGRSSIRPYFPRVFGKHPNFGEQKFSKTKVSGVLCKTVDSLLRGSELEFNPSLPSSSILSPTRKKHILQNFTLTYFADAL